MLSQPCLAPLSLTDPTSHSLAHLGLDETLGQHLVLQCRQSFFVLSLLFLEGWCHAASHKGTRGVSATLSGLLWVSGEGLGAIA